MIDTYITITVVVFIIVIFLNLFCLNLFLNLFFSVTSSTIVNEEVLLEYDTDFIGYCK